MSVLNCKDSSACSDIRVYFFSCNRIFFQHDHRHERLWNLLRRNRKNLSSRISFGKEDRINANSSDELVTVDAKRDNLKEIRRYDTFKFKIRVCFTVFAKFRSRLKFKTWRSMYRFIDRHRDITSLYFLLRVRDGCTIAVTRSNITWHLCVAK